MMGAILYCTEFFRKSMDENKHVTISLLDLSKAFNSINHDHLKNKLYDVRFS